MNSDIPKEILSLKVYDIPGIENNSSFNYFSFAAHIIFHQLKNPTKIKELQFVVSNNPHYNLE